MRLTPSEEPPILYRVASWNWRRAAVGLGVVTSVLPACSDPVQPSQTTIIPPPVITCPATPPPILATSAQSAPVSFVDPSITGGTPPVTTACTPRSGAIFPVGSTTVTCTATDAVHRTSTCTFTATVLPLVPVLAVSRILAFGDSITEGEVPVLGEFSVTPIRPRFVELASSYPAMLARMLTSRYTGQRVSLVNALTLHADNTTDCSTNPQIPAGSGIVMINAGCLGESAASVAAYTRLNDKLNVYRPDLILLLEGTNDISESSPAASIVNGVAGVVAMIRAAEAHSIPVLVGTLLPQIAADITHGGAPDLVAQFNAQLVQAANANGAGVVDLYSDISSDVNDWISPYDGLHPTEAGYQEIARVWFEAIHGDFEASDAISARLVGPRKRLTSK